MLKLYRAFLSLARQYQYMASDLRQNADKCRLNNDIEEARYLEDLAKRYEEVGSEIMSTLIRELKC